MFIRKIIFQLHYIRLFILPDVMSFLVSLRQISPPSTACASDRSEGWTKRKKFRTCREAEELIQQNWEFFCGSCEVWSGWWRFQILLLCSPPKNWGKWSKLITVIYFKWVETTNQFFVWKEVVHWFGTLFQESDSIRFLYNVDILQIIVEWWIVMFCSARLPVGSCCYTQGTQGWWKGSGVQVRIAATKLTWTFANLHLTSGILWYSWVHLISSMKLMHLPGTKW